MECNKCGKQISGISYFFSAPGELWEKCRKCGKGFCKHCISVDSEGKYFCNECKGIVKMNGTIEKANKKINLAPLGLLILFLVIPVVAFIASYAIQGQLDTNFRTALLKDYPERSTEISTLTASSACSNQKFRAAAGDFCELNDIINLMRLCAIFTAVLGIGLLIIIKIAGLITRGSRRFLLLIFKPGLHITMLALSLLMILNASLGIFAIYYGESVFLGRVHVFVIVGLGLGALFGVISMFKAQLSTTKRASVFVLGKKLEPEHQPKIWEFVNEQSRQMGAERPQAIVAGLEPNFYVTEADVICLDGTIKGRTMYVSMPLCRILNVEEIKAVLDHELAHYKGLDTKFSKKFYPIYRGATQGLVNISSGYSDHGAAGQIVLMPAMLTLAYFLNSFSVAENKISRERELAADSEAAKHEGSQRIATALVKIQTFSTIWNVVQQLMCKSIGEGKMIINASEFYSTIVQDRDKENPSINVLEEGPAHPTDSHPPLNQRFENLNLTLNDVMKDVENTAPRKPAIGLFDNVETLEKELTEAEHMWMVRTGRAQAPVENPNKEETENKIPAK